MKKNNLKYAKDFLTGKYSEILNTATNSAHSKKPIQNKQKSGKRLARRNGNEENSARNFYISFSEHGKQLNMWMLLT